MSASFRGRLEIPGISIPEQDFIAKLTHTNLVFENRPEGAWPEIRIELDLDREQGSLRIRRFLLRPSSTLVEAELLFTRLRFCIVKSGAGSLFADDRKILGLENGTGFGSSDPSFYTRTILSRKLKYIQEVFREKFILPEQITQDDIMNIDLVYRGITEGKFSVRAEGCFIDRISIREFDPANPPFNTPRTFSRRMICPFTLFEKQLDVGPVTVVLEKALLSDPRVIDEIRKSPTTSVNIRLEVLDNQITYTFERYAQQSRKRRKQRLDRFKQMLAREEPKELVDLIDESLQLDVTADEAVQIAVGWLQYNDLPDRFCPQEPELDLTAGCWHVPIFLIYTNGKGGSVGEIIIDLKSGKIFEHTLIEELNRRGMALAEQILHAG